MSSVPALLMTPQKAQAFELFGIHLWGDEDEGEVDVIDPHNYEVTITADDDTAKDITESASALWEDRDDPASGSAGVIAKARGDYRNIIGAMYDEARYGPVVSIKINGQEASEIELDAPLPNPVPVEITVSAGPEFEFGRAEIGNRYTGYIKTEDDIGTSPEDVGFETGEPARAGVVDRAARATTRLWRQLGYPKATAYAPDAVADHDRQQLDVYVPVEPGSRANFGRTSIAGTERMDPNYTVYMADIPEGQEFDPDVIEEAEERIGRLDVFRMLRFEEPESINPDGSYPIHIEVEEKPLRRISFGAELSSLDGVSLESYWYHRNLFGRAERLRFDASVSRIGSSEDISDIDDVNDIDYSVGVTYTMPGLFDPDLDFVSSVFAEQEVFETYRDESVSARTGFNYIYDKYTSGSLFAVVEKSEVVDATGTQEFLLFGAESAIEWDRRDSETDPRSGFYLRGTFDAYYEAEYENFPLRPTLEGRYYKGFGTDNRFVLAGRVKVGSLLNTDLDEAPNSLTFYAGGGGSVRGYEYKQIGIVTGQDEDGDDIVEGGLSLVETSVEFRADITDNWGAVAFVDGGLVTDETTPDFSGDMLFGAGLGIRRQTGLGPIRVDVAVPLDKDKADENFGVYIGLGQAF
ncbi:autotransporter assembly complex protein TamA [Paracoccaceae bacterium GXU_MW_L88]